MGKRIALFCVLFTSLTVLAAQGTQTEAYNSVRSRVISIVAQQLNRSESEITEDSSFVGDLKANQTDLEAIMTAIGDEVGSPVTLQSAEKISTVQKAINYIFIRQQ